MDNYRIDMTVKERKNNFWRPVDKMTSLEPKEAIIIIESKYNDKGTKLTGRRLFDVLGLAWDETANNLDILLGAKRRK